MPAAGDAQTEPPVSAREFATLMAAALPSGQPEKAVHLAVAVSGGADSMALALLADDWAKRRGGRAVALTIDHGLRASSGAEARQVGRWLGPRGVRHRTLVWHGHNPLSAIQAAAREARYRLLCAWCREHGVEHLLVAHHRDDQAETFLMRLRRGSGPDGLAAMAVRIKRDGVSILRPLLPVTKARLRATCRARGQSWIEDPSNRDPRFARSGLRASLAAGSGSVPAVLAAAAERFGEARAAREEAVRNLLKGAVTEEPSGYCRLDWTMLADAPTKVATRALAQVLRRVGGMGMGPRTTALAALYRAIARGLNRTRTLHRCLLSPVGGPILLVCREPRDLPITPIARGGSMLWDRRFAITWDGNPLHSKARVAPLGTLGWHQIRRQAQRNLPARARDVVPALWRGSRIVAVPHLGVGRPQVGFCARFAPAAPLLPQPFAVVSRSEYPILEEAIQAAGVSVAASMAEGGRSGRRREH